MQTVKLTITLAVVGVVLSGCAQFQKKETVSLRIHEQVTSGLPPENAMPVEVPTSRLKLTISPFPILTEKDVLSASLYDTAGGKAIYLRFNPHGTFILDEATTRNRAKYLVSFLNNRPVAAWLVNQRILNGQFLIEGDFSDEEAQKAVEALNKLAKAANRE